ncbi:MAG: cell envelope integrity protein TolA [Gammaproteobacteria bacterium]|nr:cell envelope integrity protein TolA [Gammaproteobacteria bacterium]
MSKWVRLEGTGGGLKCKLRVRLAKGGSVLAVSVIESSGSGAFDRSAEAAVYKADPLPVPDDQLFEQFRDIIFVFDPNR